MSYIALRDRERNRVTNRRWERENPVARWVIKIKAVYDLLPEDITAAIISQEGLCAICSLPPGDKHAERFVIDHDPITGKFRGLIHNRENRALGSFGDTLAGVQRVVRYLEAA